MNLQQELDQRTNLQLSAAEFNLPQLADNLRNALLIYHGDLKRLVVFGLTREASNRALPCPREKGDNGAVILEGIVYRGEAACRTCKNMLTCAVAGTTSVYQRADTAPKIDKTP